MWLIPLGLLAVLLADFPRQIRAQNQAEVLSIATGSAHTCVILAPDGGVRCWGLNADGQLGFGDRYGPVQTYSPASSDVLSGVSALAAGDDHTCALLAATGGVRCWGGNYFGQLGTGDPSGASVFNPPSADILIGVSAVVTGSDFTCVLLSATSGVRCWGENGSGQLGNGDSSGTNVYSPPANDVLIGVSAISIGDSHTCVLMMSIGGVRCWGLNGDGQLGNGDTSGTNVYSPPADNVLTGAAAVACGRAHTCVLMMSTGGVRCWGWNGHGQLGNGDTSGADVHTPPFADVVTGAAAVACGSAHTCVLMISNGSLRCWGSNGDGQLGDGNTSRASLYSPPSSDVLSTVSAIVTGDLHTCALSNGIWCWGSNQYGQLGDGDSAGAYLLSPQSISIPPSLTITGTVSLSVTPSPGPGFFLSVTAGLDRTCVVLSSDGGVRYWGANVYGSLGNGVDGGIVFSPPATNAMTGVSGVFAGDGYSTCVLVQATAGVRCWGDNGAGQLGNGDTSVGGGMVFSPPSADVLTGVSDVSVGGAHTCVILVSSSGVRCWGENDSGQLGNGDTTGAKVYSPPSSDVLRGVRAISARNSHTCALMVSGGVRCWGWNAYGQLGNGDSTGANVYNPPLSDVLLGASAVSAGELHTCALMAATGGVRCWGSNSNGQLGNGDTTASTLYSPPSFDVLTLVSAVVAGDYDFTCVLMASNGGVRCWGANYYGQLGVGNTSVVALSPPSTDLLTGVTAIVSGDGHTCALSQETSSLWCWGYNFEGQVGIGDTTGTSDPPNVLAPQQLTFPGMAPSMSNSPSPSVQQSVGLAVLSISAGGAYTCVLLALAGAVRCWGLLYNGGHMYLPPSTNVVTDVSALSTGYSHSCVLMRLNGGVRCWGGNHYGQLGIGDPSNVIVDSPAAADVIAGVKAISTGSDHTCVLMSSTGGVRCWGQNYNGQLGNGNTTGSNVYSPPATDVLIGVNAISTGAYYTCVLMMSIGGVRCWGWNGDGQLGNGDTTGANVYSPPADNVVTGAAAVACGSAHTCVLMMSTGGVRCWGYNFNGQLGNGDVTFGASVYSPPSTDLLAGVATVATGEAHTCVVMLSNGGVRCWGWNIDGQLGDGNTSRASLYSPPSSDVLSTVSDVVTGSAHTCVLMIANKGVRCWGSNGYGELGNGDNTGANVYSPPNVSLVIPPLSGSSGNSHVSLDLGLGLGLPVIAAVLFLLFKSLNGRKPSATVEPQAPGFASVHAEGALAAPREHINGSVRTMYHGTPMHNVASIDKEGRLRPSTGGMLGPGVYCSVQFEKAVAYARGNGVVYTLEVRVGKVKKIDRQGHPLQQTWREHGYDTAWVPRGTTDMAPSGLEENCVWDPSRIRIVGRTVIPQSGMSAV